MNERRRSRTTIEPGKRGGRLCFGVVHRVSRCCGDIAL